MFGINLDSLRSFCMLCNFYLIFSCRSSKQPHQMRAIMNRFENFAYVNRWKAMNGRAHSRNANTLTCWSTLLELFLQSIAHMPRNKSSSSTGYSHTKQIASSFRLFLVFKFSFLHTILSRISNSSRLLLAVSLFAIKQLICCWLHFWLAHSRAPEEEKK